MQPDHRARYTFGFALLAALLAALLLGALSLKVRGGAHSAHRHR